jgi:hypothetical protein
VYKPSCTLPLLLLLLQNTNQAHSNPGKQHEVHVHVSVCKGHMALRKCDALLIN